MKNTNISLDFLPFLAILFIGLKLTGYIAWSWWWVLSPLLVIPIMATILILAIATKIYSSK